MPVPLVEPCLLITPGQTQREKQQQFKTNNGKKVNNTDHKKSGKPVPKSHSTEENPLTKKSEEIGVISQDVNLKREGLVKTLISLSRNTQVAISA